MAQGKNYEEKPARYADRGRQRERRKAEDLARQTNGRRRMERSWKIAEEEEECACVCVEKTKLLGCGSWQ